MKQTNQNQVNTVKNKIKERSKSLRNSQIAGIIIYAVFFAKINIIRIFADCNIRN